MIIQMAKDRFKKHHYVREWRKAKGWTQEVMSEKIGISRAYLAQIETGARDYSQDFLEAAALAIGCSPAELIMRDPAKGEMLWAIADQLTESQTEQLVEMAKILKRGA